MPWSCNHSETGQRDSQKTRNKRGARGTQHEARGNTRHFKVRDLGEPSEESTIPSSKKRALWKVLLSSRAVLIWAKSPRGR